MPDVDRNILYTHFDYDINDSLQFTHRLLVGQGRHGELPGRTVERRCSAFGPTTPTSGLLDAASRALVDAAPASRCGRADARPTAAPVAAPATHASRGPPRRRRRSITKDFGTQQNQRIHTEAEVYSRCARRSRATSVTRETWTWDAYYQLGHATRDQIGADYRTQYRFLLADRQRDQPGDGSARLPRQRRERLRSAVYPFAGMDPFLVQGCAPINPFGQTMSAAASRLRVRSARGVQHHRSASRRGLGVGRSVAGLGRGPDARRGGRRVPHRRARQPHEQDASAGLPRRHVADVRQRLRRRDEGLRSVRRGRAAAARRQAGRRAPGT